MTIDLRQDGIAGSARKGASVRPRGVRIGVNGLSRRIRDGKRGELTLLDTVGITLFAGELVAIVGSSGAGKTILAEGGSPLGPPLLASYGDAGTRSTGTYWLVLGAFAVVFLVATWGVIARSTRR